MKKQKTLIAVAIFITIWAATALLQQYKLYTFEADHLFLYNLSWIGQHLSHAGGVALLISSFLTQFFYFPILTAIITTLLYYLVWWSLNSIIKMTLGRENNLLSFLPILPLFLCIEEPFYGFRGHTATVITLLFCCLYLKQTATNKHTAITTILVTIIVHYIVGTSILFASLVLTTALLRKQKASDGVIAVILALLGSFLCYQIGQFTSFAQALTPLQFYNWPTSYTIALSVWITIICTIILTYYTAKNNKQTIIDYTITIASIVVTGFIYNKIHNPQTYKMLYECCMADKENWKAIIKHNKKLEQDTYFLSYTNLALAKQGKLLDEMFLFYQQIPNQQVDIKKVSNEVLRLRSHFYYHSNYIAATRKASFNSSLITPGGVQPHDMLHFIATNKIVNTAQATQKYVDILEQTLFYADTARALFAQPNIGNLPEQNNFFEIDGFTNDFAHVIDANPQNAVAKQFYLAYILLSADKNSLRNYISAHANEPLHPRLQEACTIMFTPDECQQLGVSNEIMQQFEALKQGKKLQHFYQTYWFYIAYLNTTMKK